MQEKKIGQVLIKSLKYDLLDIPCKEHKHNGYLSTTWVKKEKDLFNEEVEYIPWLDKGTNKDCWGVVIKQGNSMKFKYNQWDIQGHTTVTITYNNDNIYEFNTDNLEFAFNEAQNKIYRLKQLPLNYPDCEDKDLVNWWNNLSEPWFDDYHFEHLEECKGLGEVKVDMLSELIYWNRNDRKTKLNKIKRKVNKKGT